MVSKAKVGPHIETIGCLLVSKANRGQRYWTKGYLRVIDAKVSPHSGTIP